MLSTPSIHQLRRCTRSTHFIVVLMLKANMLRAILLLSLMPMASAVAKGTPSEVDGSHKANTKSKQFSLRKVGNIDG